MGASDGWQDFDQHGAMTWAFDRAEAGNVALTGELPGGEGVLALGFAETPEGAHTLAVSNLTEGFGPIRRRFLARWQDWGQTLDLPHAEPALKRQALVSAAVLKVHEDKTYPGAVVASLSTPWGFAHDDPGGYHLVWPRDAAEAGLSLLAAGQAEDARRRAQEAAEAAARAAATAELLAAELSSGARAIGGSASFTSRAHEAKPGSSAHTCS